MNVESVKNYMIEMNKKKFKGTIDFKNVEFHPYSSDGIIIDLTDGIHTVRVGTRVNTEQVNRALSLILIDTVMETKNEDERASKGYSEFGGMVSKVQYKFFPKKDVFVEDEDGIKRDTVIDCNATMCNLKKAGAVKKDKIIGLTYKEVQLDIT